MDIPLWSDGLKQESIQNALKVGVIYPKFKAYKNTPYEIFLLSEPKYVDNEKVEKPFFTIDIEKDGMKYTLNMNESFKFQLKVLLERNKAELSDLIKKGIPLRIAQDDEGYWSIQLL